MVEPSGGAAGPSSLAWDVVVAVSTSSGHRINAISFLAHA
jgi:hypothetical protein